MSGATIARRQTLAKWAAELGEAGCREFLASATETLKARAMGRRHSSAEASRLQAQIAACRKVLRQHRRACAPAEGLQC